MNTEHECLEEESSEKRKESKNVNEMTRHQVGEIAHERRKARQRRACNTVKEWSITSSFVNLNGTIARGKNSFRAIRMGAWMDVNKLEKDVLLKLSRKVSYMILMVDWFAKQS